MAPSSDKKGQQDGASSKKNAFRRSERPRVPKKRREDNDNPSDEKPKKRRKPRASTKGEQAYLC